MSGEGKAVRHGVLVEGVTFLIMHWEKLHTYLNRSGRVQARCKQSTSRPASSPRVDRATFPSGTPSFGSDGSSECLPSAGNAVVRHRACYQHQQPYCSRALVRVSRQSGLSVVSDLRSQTSDLGEHIRRAYARDGDAQPLYAVSFS